MANTAEHKAAEQSLSDYLGIVCPLPHIAQNALEWHLKKQEDARLDFIENILCFLYDNDHRSYREKVTEALEGFNVTARG